MENNQNSGTNNNANSEKEESMFSFLSSRKSDTLSETPNNEKISDTLDKSSDITSMSSKSIESEPIKTTSSSGSAIMGFFSKINFTTIILIIIALGILGFNIFSYLSEATETTSGILKPIIDRIYKFFGYAVTDTAKTTIKIGAKGAKLGVDVVAGTATSAIDTTQSLALDNDMPVPTEIPMPEDADIDENVQKKKEAKKNVVVVSDDSQSVFQKTNGSKKTGWCFIGEDKGVRSCINVQEGDKCMSKEIFPSRELCMNPGLRE